VILTNPSLNRQRRIPPALPVFFCRWDPRIVFGNPGWPALLIPCQKIGVRILSGCGKTRSTVIPEEPQATKDLSISLKKHLRGFFASLRMTPLKSFSAACYAYLGCAGTRQAL
jgi:hypothetical protein